MLRLPLSIALGLTLLGGSATMAAASPPPVDHHPTVAWTAPSTWTIQIDTEGHQPELDQCLWVRMDFTDTVPIVGKHNYCGGDIVLNMTRGQTVQLTGLGLDGRYIVTGDRQAFSGDLPSDATAGLDATVILQTCWFDTTLGMRLVTLTLLPAVPHVVVGAS